MRHTALPIIATLLATAAACADEVGCDFRFGFGYVPGPSRARNSSGTDFTLSDNGGVATDIGVFLTIPARAPVAWIIGFSFESHDSSGDFDDALGAQVNSLDYSSFGLRIDSGIVVQLGRRWSLEPVVFVGFGGATGDFHDGPGAGTNHGSYGEIGTQLNAFVRFNWHWRLGFYGGVEAFSASLEDDVKVRGSGVVAGVTGGYAF